MLTFGENVRWVVPDPLPLADSMYAFINVDNCERPLTAKMTLRGQLGTGESSKSSQIFFYLVTLYGYLKIQTCSIELKP